MVACLRSTGRRSTREMSFPIAVLQIAPPLSGYLIHRYDRGIPLRSPADAGLFPSRASPLVTQMRAIHLASDKVY